MELIEKLKPKFWNHVPENGSQYKYQFNFRRIWNLAVLLTAGVTLVPLITMTVIHYQVTQNAIESEIYNHTYRTVRFTWWNISNFLDERTTVLDLIARDITFEELNDPDRLNTILKNLQKRLGGLVDLGVIDSSGKQTAYAGPYKLTNVDYSKTVWFKDIVKRGIYISDLFLGLRNIPHIVIAGRYSQEDGSFYILRATLDMHPIDNMLNELELSKNGDAFIINKEGILQTPSRYHGKVLEHINLSVPVYSSKAEVIEDENPQGEPLIIGYAYIPDTPFILMIVQKKDELMESWYKRRIELIWFLAISITIILFVILSVVTYLVNKLYLADQEHLTALHHMEYSNRLASIGRLAAGVAHEINNPLAIINEKAGLIKDMFTYQKKYSEDKKLIGLVDSIITSVERCSTITKRLLGFARHMDVRIEPVNLEKIIHEVLGFLEKEASYRSIKVSVQVDPDVPEFESDRGKLQQIFLNLINNAFGAMEEGGRLTIKVKREGKDFITALVSDTGCGIPKKDLERIFCPFFSTKTEKGGTGLGLSITCGLVREIGGKMDVHSEVGKGTTFKLTLPLKGNK